MDDNHDLQYTQRCTTDGAVGGMERAWERGAKCVHGAVGRNGENLGTSLNSLMIVDVPQVRLVLFHQLVFLVLILHPHLALQNKHNKTCSRKNTRGQHTRGQHTRGQHKSAV